MGPPGATVIKVSNISGMITMMDCVISIRPPEDADDAAGAVRVFQEFLGQYQNTLTSAEHYFEQVMTQVKPQFAPAYAPWQSAVKDLLQGVYIVAKRLPMHNPKALADALRLFSLDSAIAMLKDVCISCKIDIVHHQWAETFKRNMRALDEAFRVLLQNRVIARVR